MRQLLPLSRPLADGDLLDLYGGEDLLLRAGFVLAADGSAVLDGSSRPLQTTADQAVFRALRAVSDAVVVGAGTARREGYGAVRPRPEAAAWRRGRGMPEQPTLVLVSRSLALDPAARCFEGPAVVVTCAAADPARRAALAEVADVVVAGGQSVDLADAVGQLHERGLRSLLCEGGPTLLTALLAADLVDELCLTCAPVLVGAAPALLPAALPSPVPLSLVHLVDGGDGSLLFRWAVARRSSAVSAAPSCST